MATSFIYSSCNERADLQNSKVQYKNIYAVILAKMKDISALLSIRAKGNLNKLCEDEMATLDAGQVLIHKV